MTATKRKHLFLVSGNGVRYGALVFILLAIPFTVIALSTGKNPSTHASSTSLTASGINLLLNGKVTQFTGVNAYEIATNLHVNPGCGPTVSNPDAFFSSLRANSLVRIWGFEGSMTKYNSTTKQFDWSALDAVFTSAAKYNQLIILTVGNQWGTCDDNRYKDTSFYNGGYTAVYNPKGTTPVSYWNYMQALVNHYKSNPALGMWELMNEPEAQECVNGNDNSGKCSGSFSCNESLGEQSLKSFFDTVGKKVKQLDPNHLVESGVIGSGQCGASGGDYQSIHASTGIDVASYHDYGSDTSPMPGDQYNGLQVRLNQMKKVNKPLIIGEVGMKAQNNTTNCMSLSQRVTLMKNKMNAQFPSGIDAFIPWDWMPSNNKQCAYETITNSDPLMTLLHTYPLLGNSPSGQISTLTQNASDTVSSAYGFTDLPLRVSIIEPDTESVLTPGQTVNLTAVVSGQDRNTTVLFYVNNTLICSAVGQPFACTWTVPEAANARYVIVAQATESTGMSVFSSPFVVSEP